MNENLCIKIVLNSLVVFNYYTDSSLDISKIVNVITEEVSKQRDKECTHDT